MKKYILGILGLICGTIALIFLFQLNLDINEVFSNIQTRKADMVVVSSSQSIMLIAPFIITGILLGAFQIKRHKKFGIITLFVNIGVLCLSFIPVSSFGL